MNVFVLKVWRFPEVWEDDTWPEVEGVYASLDAAREGHPGEWLQPPHERRWVSHQDNHDAYIDAFELQGLFPQ